MTDEEEFEQVLLSRIAEAKDKTGYSFFGLLTSIGELGAVEAARRLIGPGNCETFQDGVRELRAAGLLNLSVEQAVIDFGEKGKIFTDKEVLSARERLTLIRLLLR